MLLDILTAEIGPEYVESITMLSRTTRKVRNIEIISDDILRLVNGNQKITGTAINAFAAQVQDKAESFLGQTDYCVFSSLLGPLVMGTMRESSGAGTILEHLSSACSASKERLTAKPRWIVPLCGPEDSPQSQLHWVLGWIDFSQKVVGIFDSIPELNSSYWAKPILHRIADKICDYAGISCQNWGGMPWRPMLYSPEKLECQYDNWSCGLFVIMAIEAITLPDNLYEFPGVGISNLHKARKKAWQKLLSIPIVRIAPKQDLGRSESESDVEVVEQTTSKDSNQPTQSPITHPITLPYVSDAVILRDNSKSVNPIPITKPLYGRPAEKIEKERFTKRRRLGGLAQRNLENHEWADEVEEFRIKCRGCKKWIQLNMKRAYDNHNFVLHTQRCATITRKVLRRRMTVLKNDVKPSNRNTSITQFFSVSSSSRGIASDKESRSETELAEQSRTYKVVVDRVDLPTAITTFFKPCSKLGEPGPRGEVATQTTEYPITEREIICKHLDGGEYTEFIRRTFTRSLGGISPSFRLRCTEQLFPYKYGVGVAPKDGNRSKDSPKWTDAEHIKLDRYLLGWARWEVDQEAGFVKSSRCEGRTKNKNEICDMCTLIACDESFMRAVRKKNEEVCLPEPEQHEILMRRLKFTPRMVGNVEARKLQRLLKDSMIFGLFTLLEKGNNTECFLRLYKMANTGKLAKKHELFASICTIFAEHLRRESSPNKRLRCGIRYPQDYVNFMILMRSHGHNSARQYSLLQQQIGGPSIRHLRTLVASSSDALSNPYLIFENMARVKRFTDSVGYGGPVAIAGDCTKVRSRLTYSTDFGGHILGSIFDPDQCEVTNPEDIDLLVKRVIEEKALATQVRAILVKIPLPQFPPQVVALLPANGTDDADKIVELQFSTLKMAANLKLPIVSFAADGASSELLAQKIMESQEPERPALRYDDSSYGIHLRTPVFSVTGPVVFVTDPPHARKTFRNQPQHGTHTASLGVGVVTSRSLIGLQQTAGSGLVVRDVENVDKQDDGAARRLFHVMALKATTTAVGAETKVREGSEGLFVYLFIFGSLSDAWLNRKLSTQKRVLLALRAQFFLHAWLKHIESMSRIFPDLYSTKRSFISAPCFQIVNRLCDSLVLLAKIYSETYPDVPFCPWLLGTDFVEHFFGLARMILPNFTYAEFLKIVQHVMVRQQILLSGKFSEKREKSSASGYELEYDASPLSVEELESASMRLANEDIHALALVAFTETNQITKKILRIKPLRLPVTLVRLGTSISKKALLNDDSDSESESDPDKEWVEPEANVSDQSEAELIGGIAADTARYSALCRDFDVLKISATNNEDMVTVPADKPQSTTGCDITASMPIQSEILDESGQISITLMINEREQTQSATRVHSERTTSLDPKFVIHRVRNELEKLDPKEAAHRLRVAQDLDSTIQNDRRKKDRELRWQAICKELSKLAFAKDVPNLRSQNVSALHPLTIGSFVLMQNKQRTYLGEILDHFKRTAGKKHVSVSLSTSSRDLSYLSLKVYLPLVYDMVPRSLDEHDKAMSEDNFDSQPLIFLSTYDGSHIFTHAPVSQLLYHLGRRVFQDCPSPGGFVLKDEPAKQWRTFNQAVVAEKLAKIKIPGGRMG